MRRNINRRGNNNAGGVGGGPLMTGHLQDIDLELALLKRKREMIEQQQQLLVMEQQFKTSRHSYDQMRFDEPDHSNRDFTHLYETGPKHRNQLGRKRQAENQWQYDSAPKRTPPKKKNQSQFNQHGSGNSGSGTFRGQRPQQGQGPNQGPKFSPRMPAPLMDVKIPKQSIGQKIANQKAAPKPPNKDFKPSKVSKPKAPPAPNKMVSHTVTERKSLVAAATESSSDGDVSLMLLPDRVPSQQVSGRLELALGAIMKSIRALIDNQPQHGTVLRSIQLQRVMKQAVRERIRTVMLGKVVGSLLDILAIYREEFPEETDADILNIALEAGGVSGADQKTKTLFIESENPSDFFKANMSCLLETKLNEMFSKLEDIYSNAPQSDPSEEQIDLKKIKEENKNKEVNAQEYANFLNTTVKVHDVKRILPKLMKRYVPYIMKLINIDGIYQTTKAAVTMKANEKAANIVSTIGSEVGQGDGQATVPASQTPNNGSPMNNLPYYVKIMGHPTLPKKKVLQGFLSQFNPKSIKKHRSIHNLLFVGFTEKTDYDVMVGADGTVVGRSTLSVRINPKIGPRESNGENGENNDTSLGNDVSLNKIKREDGDIIPKDLDCQITDLLSSIRKSEEEDTEKKENSEETDNNDDKEKPQNVSELAENNSDEVQMDKGGDVKTDEEIIENVDNEVNAGNEENTEEIIDETRTEENLGDNNITSQEEVAEDDETNAEPANETETENTETTGEANTENLEVTNGTEKPEVTETTDDFTEEKSQETNEGEMDAQQFSEKTPTTTEEQSDDKVGELKSNATGRSTPSRMSARLANVTPSTIRTRRASKLASQT